MRLVAILAVVILPVAPLIPACGGQGDQAPKDEHKVTAATVEEATKLAEPVYAALTKIADAFPDAGSLSNTKCPPDVTPGKTLGMSWNALAKLTKRPISAAEKEVWDVAKIADVGRVHRLPPHGEPQKYPSKTTFTEAVESFNRRTHVRILRVAAGKATNTTSTTTFEGGHLTGHLVVFDKAANVVCSWEIEAKSSAKVAYSFNASGKAGDKASKARHAVKEDLKRAARKAMTDARGKMKAERAAK